MKRRISLIASALLAFLTSAILWLSIFSAAGFSVLVVGVFVLAGQGWAYIAAGVALLAVAGFIRRGMIHA